MPMDIFDQTLSLFRQLLRFNTTNPPGDVEDAALFLEVFLKESGLETRIIAPSGKRANLYARIKGRNNGKPVILLGHIDVVPANPDEWEVDPFGGEIIDGFVYGRGAIDMKSQVACQVAALAELSRKGVLPERDIVFLATCDEETGGDYGVRHILEKMPELGEASFVMSEGGSVVDIMGVVHAQISVAEKEIAQFVIRAKGRGGHGSMPHNDNANEKVLKAAQAIVDYKWPLTPTRIIDAYLNGVLRGRKGRGFTFKTLRDALQNRSFVKFVESDPLVNALLRNTVALTVLRGGEKTNVIPSESTAIFDARLITTEVPERFFRKIRRLAGPDVEMVPARPAKDKPVLSDFRTQYYNGLEEVARSVFGDIPVLPYVTTGATDLRHFRDLGIPAYGFFPIDLPMAELFRMHGRDERISLENLQKGLEGTCRITDFLATVP